MRPAGASHRLRSSRFRRPRESACALLARRKGVSLVELVVVLLILGIFAAVAAPKFAESLTYHRVEAAARRLKIDLAQLRQAARRTSSPRSLTFQDSTTYTLSPDVADPDHPDQSYTVDLTATPYRLDAMTVDFDGETSVTFDGYGNPSHGGQVTLKADDWVCVVTLDGITGNATKSDTTSLNGA